MQLKTSSTFMGMEIQCREERIVLLESELAKSIGSEQIDLPSKKGCVWQPMIILQILLNSDTQKVKRC